MTERVEWSRDPTDSRVDLAVAHVLAGAFAAGVLVVPFALLGFFGLRAALAGNFTMLAVVVVLALIGSYASILYLVPILTDPELTRRFHQLPQNRGLRPAGVVLGAVAAAVLAVVVVVPLALVIESFRIALGGFFLLLVVPMFRWVEGAVDPTGATLELYTQTFEIDGMTGFRSIRVVDTSLFWLSYATGRGGIGTPQLLAVPATDAPDVRRALEAIADPDAEPRPGAANERRIVTAVGAVLVVAAAGLYLAPPLSQVPAGARSLLALVVGGMGVLFLVVAWFE